jgi:hypothetical protein
MWWVGQNSAAIQAVSAVVTVIVTGILCCVTTRYVVLTSAIADTTQKQLSASLQPVLTMGVRNDILGNSPATMEQRQANISGSFHVANTGNTPFKIKQVYIVPEYSTPDKPFKQDKYMRPGIENRIVMPHEQIEEQYNFNTAMDYSNIKLVRYGIILDCTDLSEVAMHRFTFHPTKGIHHEFRPRNP